VNFNISYVDYDISYVDFSISYVGLSISYATSRISYVGLKLTIPEAVFHIVSLTSTIVTSKLSILTLGDVSSLNWEICIRQIHFWIF
jgi:hypothetical protein